jgi:hypothetical protein
MRFLAAALGALSAASLWRPRRKVENKERPRIGVGIARIGVNADFKKTRIHLESRPNFQKKP